MRLWAHLILTPKEKGSALTGVLVLEFKKKKSAVGGSGSLGYRAPSMGTSPRTLHTSGNGVRLELGSNLCHQQVRLDFPSPSPLLFWH